MIVQNYLQEESRVSKKLLSTYRAKRKFAQTSEPQGKKPKKSTGKKAPIFVIQKHDARALHYDLRLEDEGVLKSWAIPKGPSTDPDVKHLAAQTEDHPFEYKDFEGMIPEGNYGAGGVIIWDKGTYKNLKAPLSLSDCIKNGHVVISFNGKKMHGNYALIRTHMRKNSWLFFKMKDDQADRRKNITKSEPDSVVSGKSIAEIEKGSFKERKK